MICIIPSHPLHDRFAKGLANRLEAELLVLPLTRGWRPRPDQLVVDCSGGDQLPDVTIYDVVDICDVVQTTFDANQPQTLEGYATCIRRMEAQLFA